MIFGYKQRGIKAEEFDNLFQASTYDDFNYDDFNDTKKINYLVSLIELGQIPKKLFSEEHKKKKIPAIQMLEQPPEDLKRQIQILKDENEEYQKELKREEMQLELDKEEKKMKLNSILKEKEDILDDLKK